MNRIESVLQIGGGWILWGVSSALSVGLFLSLAGTTLAPAAVAAAVALSLELSKIILWRRGGLMRVFSVGFVLLSLIASGGGSLVAVDAMTRQAEAQQSQATQEARRQAVEAVRQSPQYLRRAAAVDALDSEISLWQKRIQDMPSQWAIRAASTSAMVQELRQDRKEIVNTLSKMERFAEREAKATVTHTGGTMFTLASEKTGIPEEVILLTILLFTACLIEAGSLVLLSGSAGGEIVTQGAPQRATQAPPSRPPEPISIPDRIGTREPLEWFNAFLRKSEDGYIVPGRHNTCEELGETDHAGKTALSLFFKLGLMDRHPEQRRLVFCDGAEIQARRLLGRQAVG